MNETLKKQIARIFPELIAGYHLPVMAEVIKIQDAPKAGGISNNFRPRYAVDLQILNKDLEPLDIIVEAVPVGIPAAGHERGFFGLPEVGTLVALSWFYGLPERPYVSAILGERKALPALDEGEQLWQQRAGVAQRVDQQGNWTRHTDEQIHDSAFQLIEDACQKLSQLGSEIKTISEYSTEDIQGIKQIEAGAIHQLSESVINLIAAGSINQLASDRSTRTAGENIEDSAEGEIKQSAKLDLSQNTEANAKLKAANNIEQQAGANYNIKANAKIEQQAGADIQITAGGQLTQQSGGPMTLIASGPLMLQGSAVHIGTGSVNALSLIGDYMQTLADALGILASHTHGDSPPPKQAAAIAGKQSAAQATKAQLSGISS